MAISYEEKLRRKREAYASNPEVKAKRNAEAKAYYVAHRKEVLKKVKEYRENNSEIVKARSKVYRNREDNIKAANERSSKYRANPANKQVLAYRSMQYYSRKFQATGHSTKEKLKARWDYYGGKCWICVNEAKEMDHVKPLSKGGSNWPANLRPICRSCNARKSNIWPYQLTT